MSDFDDIGFQYKFMQQTRERTPSPRGKAISNSSTSSIGMMSQNMIGLPMQPTNVPQRRFSSGVPSTISAGTMQYQNLASYGIFKK